MFYKDLAFAIIMQAIDDYRERKQCNRSTRVLEEFFKGAWCNLLLLNLRLTGQDILRYLENE